MQGSHPLSLFFLSSFPVPLCFSSYVRDQTPAGRLLVSQMSGLRGKMQLVLCAIAPRRATGESRTQQGSCYYGCKTKGT